MRYTETGRRISTQVPARIAYLTNGKSKIRKIGRCTITLKHARGPIIKRLSIKANLVLQALYYLGKGSIEPWMIMRCAALLNEQDMKGLMSAVPQLPRWLADVVLQIRQDERKVGKNSNAGGFP